MLIRETLVCILGIICGAGTAAGVVALISSLGIIPRIVGKSSTAIHIKLYEDFLLAGAAVGNILVVFQLEWNFLGLWFLLFAGVCAGIFVGCLAAALAEVIQVWPVLYRRTGTKYGINIAMFFFAMGKLAGGVYYFMMLKYLV